MLAAKFFQSAVFKGHKDKHRLCPDKTRHIHKRGIDYHHETFLGVNAILWEYFLIFFVAMIYI